MHFNPLNYAVKQLSMCPDNLAKIQTVSVLTQHYK